MTDDYPAHLLAREPAPSYQGEAPFALWHFSENPDLSRFEPRPRDGHPDEPALVWAVDTRHAPLFWFPRDCPRGCIWLTSGTSAADRERFFGQSDAHRVHVIEAGWEAGWLDRMRSSVLYAYRLPDETFEAHEVGGYWVTSQPVEATERHTVTDLLARHALAGIELRLTPSVWPFWRRVADSTVGFSGSRLRHAAPHPQRLP
jgi:hypothetical protein